jgi:predicted permease
MGFLRVWTAKATGLFTRQREDKQFDEEIQSHIDDLTERYIRLGSSRADAIKVARLQFGNVALLQERQRAQRSFLAPSEWWGDIRFGLRMMMKKPGSNAAVIIALALGIGMNVAVFSFVNALLLRPPGIVRSMDRMVELWQHSRVATGVQSYAPFDYPGYAYYRDHTQSLEGLLAFDGDGAESIWNRNGQGQVVQGQLASGNFFSLLGVNAALGRTLSTADDQIDNPHPVVVLSNSFWQHQFASDPAIVGKTMVLNGMEFVIVGVAPPGFTGLLVGSSPDFWVPLTLQHQFTHDKDRLTNRQSFWLIVAGRLRPGVDMAKAQAEIHIFARQLAKDYPDSNKDYDTLVYPATLMPGPYRGYVAGFTGLLLGVFVLVLMIACANAASFLLARATGRVREMAIRSALGAGRARLIRQMLIESLMLSSIAGLAGIAVAWWMARLLLQLKPATIPLSIATPLDWRVLLFALVVSFATGILFGLIPALRSASVEAAPALKEETQSAGLRKSRLRTILLIGEIATCVVLLAGAALCVRSLMHANSIDPGFDTQHIAVATLDPSTLGYSPDKIDAFYGRLLDRVRALPNVTAASYVSHLPLGTSREATSAGHRIAPDPDRVRVDVFTTGPEYFATMGVAFKRGRDFTQTESGSKNPGVVIVNEVLAQKLWPGQDPIGQRIAIGGDKTASEVIGEVKAGKYRTLGESPVAVIFRATLPQGKRTLVVRTAGDARPLLDELARTVQEVDPLMAVTDSQTIEEYMALPLFPARATGFLLGASGILAVVLTAIGLFGVIAYVVSQRTHEIGVRMALGARETDVLKLVMRQGLFVMAVGLLIGLAGAIAAARLLSPLLYGIGANDLATLASVAATVTAVAMLACYIPARRAMRVDPTVALRYE